MRTLTVGALATAFVAGLSLLPVPVKATMPTEMPGGDAFETKLSQQLDEANAAVEDELRNDPTLADMQTPDPAAQETVTPEPLTIDKKVEGVPGDEKFEAAFNAWLERQNEELNEELSRDPTGTLKTR